eukprot:m.122165 g.122165  ORF g.122165 m.122165 type:complete len:101 (-) comp16218_c1_seq2:4134-4436(-)
MPGTVLPNDGFAAGEPRNRVLDMVTTVRTADATITYIDSAAVVSDKESVTVSAVEAFSLDQEFDYDNVALSRKELPPFMQRQQLPDGLTTTTTESELSDA